ncbi:armadillo repeat-containing protein 4-like isoform X2 [Pollicipes pollicipes]|uniref:armadillo repeat-containing protein 4-like isoform X2 n=1 Tax=Pollicipes pollicipes TaxID=41117 RepID=UPI001884D182|nr:armadillo repeat-containing protein 4-like isoform X2 [Pollicipes pollicipes]
MTGKDSKTVKVTPKAASDNLSSSSEESSSEEESNDRFTDPAVDLPADYWQIQKLVKYLKAGNQTATVIALCALRDHQIDQEVCQLALRDVGGLEVLLNILETNDVRCKIGSLKVLKVISSHPEVRRSIASLGGLETLVTLFSSPSNQLKALASETIANVAQFRWARRIVRKSGGVPKLVDLLDVDKAVLTQPMESLTPKQLEKLEVAKGGALALWSLAKARKVKECIRMAGGITLLGRLLQSVHTELLISVMGIIQMCASEESYRLAIREEGMTRNLLDHLHKDNIKLQIHGAFAIFQMLQMPEASDNLAITISATGALWKCAIDPKNTKKLNELGIVDRLVPLLNNENEQILVNTAGALGACAQMEDVRTNIKNASGIRPLVHLLTETNTALLVNVAHAIGACAVDAESMATIDALDGVRLLWSLLKNPSYKVQAASAWAICPCIQNATDAGEMVRSFVGGLELIVGLLRSPDPEVLASVCNAISEIARDEENLAVITDHGVVPQLSTLAHTDNDRVRQYLAKAIACCCQWGQNRLQFGKQKAVAPLVRYLASKDAQVHRPSALALFQLSKEPRNCITLHENQAVSPLLAMCGSADEQLQEHAAGCLRNIRLLASAIHNQEVDNRLAKERQEESTAPAAEQTAQ